MLAKLTAFNTGTDRERIRMEDRVFGEVHCNLRIHIGRHKRRSVIGAGGEIEIELTVLVVMQVAPGGLEFPALESDTDQLVTNL